jgi:hypothetical protein
VAHLAYLGVVGVEYFVLAEDALLLEADVLAVGEPLAHALHSLRALLLPPLSAYSTRVGERLALLV